MYRLATMHSQSETDEQTDRQTDRQHCHCQ